MSDKLAFLGGLSLGPVPPLRSRDLYLTAGGVARPVYASTDLECEVTAQRERRVRRAQNCAQHRIEWGMRGAGGTVVRCCKRQVISDHSVDAKRITTIRIAPSPADSALGNQPRFSSDSL